MSEQKRWGKAHPNSLEGTADAETLRRIASGRRRASEDKRHMDEWAENGFTSGPWPEDSFDSPTALDEGEDLLEAQA